MLIRRQNLRRLLLPLPGLRNNLTGHRIQPRFPHRMAEERNAIPVAVEALALGNHDLLVTGRHRNAVDSTLEEAVRPVGEHVADVDQHRRGGVGLGAGGVDRDGGPGGGGREDLQACLALEAEEELFCAC